MLKPVDRADGNPHGFRFRSDGDGERETGRERPARFEPPPPERGWRPPAPFCGRCDALLTRAALMTLGYRKAAVELHRAMSHPGEWRDCVDEACHRHRHKIETEGYGTGSGG